MIFFHITYSHTLAYARTHAHISNNCSITENSFISRILTGTISLGTKQMKILNRTMELSNINIDDDDNDKRRKRIKPKETRANKLIRFHEPNMFYVHYINRNTQTKCKRACDANIKFAKENTCSLVWWLMSTSSSGSFCSRFMTRNIC